MRSLLFVPGDNPKKLEKALTSGADALIVDLEDSVGLERKAEARKIASVFLAQARIQRQRPQLWLRVNALASGLIDDDLDATLASPPDGIMLPKADGGASTLHLDAKVTAREALHGLADNSIRMIALATETAAAMFAAGSYREGSKRLVALTWGAEDLSAELGAETNRDVAGDFLDPYRLARSLCLIGAAAAGLPAIDTVCVDFRNDAGLQREAEGARRDGFAGKLAIHPAQVPIINAVFTPTEEAVAHARMIVDAFAASPGAGVVGIEGKMYDRPHLVRAQNLLARAEMLGGASKSE